MTIFQVEDYEYDLIQGGFGSAVYVPHMVSIPDLTHKIEAGGTRIDIDDVDFGQLRNTEIDDESLTFCIKSGTDDQNAAQVYGSGFDSFEAAITGIHGIKSAVNDYDTYGRPKIVFTSQPDNSGHIFGSFELTRWENNSNIKTMRICVAFNGIPRSYIVREYDDMFNCFGVRKPAKIQPLEHTQKFRLSTEQLLEVSEHGTTDGVKSSVDESLIPLKNNLAIQREFERDLKSILDHTPEIYSRLADKPISEVDIPDKVLHERMTILTSVARDNFYGHSECASRSAN